MMLATQNLHKLCLFTVLAEISSDISNVGGKFMQFRGDHSKTNPIYGSWSNIYRKWRKFQVILSMMVENLSYFTANTEKLTRFTKVGVIFTAMAENSSNIHSNGRKFQAIFTAMAENLRNIYGNGRMTNPNLWKLRQYLQQWQKISTLFTAMAEHLMSIFQTLRYNPGPPMALRYVTILFNHINPFSILHNQRFHSLQWGQITHFKPVTASIYTLCV
jgi:hypothetical protein